jgi:FMN hydrolase / 5-amino-6-(5-phospho-D-ribitylamino)uracil phosphatase
MPALAVVTFDLDNTLWDVDGVIRNAERVTRAWFETNVPQVYRLLGQEDFVRLRQEVLAQDARLAHHVSDLRREVFRRAIATAGYPSQQAARLADEAFEVFLHERHRVELFDDALEVLETLARTYRLGALTNGNADVGRLGLDRIFSFAFSAAAVGASKPHPAMFKAALDHSGVDASQMVHVGDHPVDDIEGASRLGIHTIWVNRKGLSYPEDAPVTREVRGLRDVPRMIGEIALRSRDG